MNTLNGITERIIQQSDSQLRDQISKIAAPLWSMIGDYPHHINATKVDDKQIVEVYYRETFRAIKELAFTVNRERYRQKAIDDFMQKVQTLDSQLQELRDSIPQ